MCNLPLCDKFVAVAYLVNDWGSALKFACFGVDVKVRKFLGGVLDARLRDAPRRGAGAKKSNGRDMKNCQTPNR